MDKEQKNSSDRMTRRSFIRSSARGVLLTGTGWTLGYLGGRGTAEEWVWQIDPSKCIYCENCATACVLSPSAVKCVHEFEICGYCRLCTGFFVPDSIALDESAENQVCPTNAVVRKFIEDPYYQYSINEDNCFGCGRCALGCNAFGNGSLYLQIRHDRCVNCNQCAIALTCPTEAIRRVPKSRPYDKKLQAQEENPQGGESEA